MSFHSSSQNRFGLRDIAWTLWCEPLVKSVVGVTELKSYAAPHLLHRDISDLCGNNHALCPVTKTPLQASDHERGTNATPLPCWSDRKKQPFALERRIQTQRGKADHLTVIIGDKDCVGSGFQETRSLCP